MRLSISNLAWGGRIDEERCAWVAAAGLQGVEIAPTALTGGDWPDPQDLRLAMSAIGDAGLRVSGLQSLFFGCEECRLFAPETWPRMVARLSHCIEVAQLLRADVLVFGSPKNRRRGSMSSEDATALAAEFFLQLVPALKAADLTVTLEPNPPQYGADFMTTYGEVLSVVDAVGSTRVQPQIDTGCLTLVGDDPAVSARTRTPQHVHISAPGLGELPAQITCHEALGQVLKAEKYAGWITLEMLRATLVDDKALDRSVSWAVRNYGNL